MRPCGMMKLHFMWLRDLEHLEWYRFSWLRVRTQLLLVKVEKRRCTWLLEIVIILWPKNCWNILLARSRNPTQLPWSTHRIWSVHFLDLDARLLVNILLQEGESAMHYAAEISPDMIHSEHEDIKIVQLLLDFHAEVGIQTKMVMFCAHIDHTTWF